MLNTSVGDLMTKGEFKCETINACLLIAHEN
jgi:hypothetical protein